MRTVIINDGETFQIDLIPETDHEISVLNSIPEDAEIRIGKASGYALCQGGYMRPFAHDGARKFTFITNAQKTET